MKEMSTLTIGNDTYKIVDRNVGSLDELNTTNKTSIVKAINEVKDATTLASRLSLGYHTDGLIYLFVDSVPVGTGIAMPSGGVEELIEFLQMNPLVVEYMEEANYSPDDYSTSVALSYAYKEADYELSHPVGCIVNIDEAGILHLLDAVSTIEYPSVAGENVLYNAIPNQVANWWNTVDGRTTQSGTIKPTGQVRMIKTTARNVRDLGGWACDGGTIRYGKLFRGGLLNDSDRAIMVDQLKIKHDLDLRGTSDNDGLTASPLGADVAYTCPDNYVWYSLDGEETWRAILSTIFGAVSSNEPLIFHCAAGADRTGTVACIVEAILGVSQPDLDRDFELTTFALADSHNARRRTDDNWKNLIGEINTIASGTTFRDKVISWVGHLGFTVDEINAFRSTMIDGEPEIVTIEEYVPGTPVEPDEPDVPDVPAEPDVPDVPYTNLAEPNTSNTTDYSVWCNNARIGGDGTVGARDGYVSTNYVAIKPGDVVRFKNFKTERLCLYKADKTMSSGSVGRPASVVDNNYISIQSSDVDLIANQNGEPTEMTFTILTAGAAADIAFLRLSGHLTGTADDVIITVNQEIVDPDQSTQYNTFVLAL